MNEMHHLDDWSLEQLAENMLSGDELSRATAHVEACGRCAAKLDGYRALYAALEGLPRLAPSPGFGDAVMARVRMPEPSPVWAMIQRWLPSTRRGWTLMIAALVAPALPVLAGLVWLMTHPGVSAGALWQTTSSGAQSTATAVFGKIVEWGLDSGIFGGVQMAFDAVRGIPIETVAGAFGILAVAIPLSAWSLYRLARTPTGNATYAN